jgi:hypothetical protein
VIPGIYFGLPIEEYRADLALGSSDIKTLASCPCDYWHQRFGPFAGEREDTVATEFGRAAHVRIVEGKAAFDAQYYQRLDKGEYPDALVTVEDIKAALVERGQKVSGKKDDLIARLLEIKPEAPIWARIVDEHDLSNAGRVPLSADGIARIEYAATMVEADPSARDLMRKGYSEVSVFWVDFETGTPLKARFDKLHSGLIVDFKTISRRDFTIDRAITRAIQTYRYDIQEAHYLDAAGQLASLPHFGEVDADWIKAVRSAQEWRFAFLFQKTDDMPLVSIRFLPPSTRQVAGDMVRKGIDAFVSYKKLCGNEPWIETTPPSVIDDSEFSAFGWR